MNPDARTLFELLPAIHRIRDAELARANGTERGPLEELLTVFAEQIGVAQENLDQLYDDLFIETCADWVVPYIGDLIGYQPLHGEVPAVASPRAEVAHTIALRRRKGTALVLEQLARDVTGWDARAVEYFQYLMTSQSMHHLRADHLHSPDLRRTEALEWVGSAFDTTQRGIDVRHIGSGRGRYNIPNVGLHLWRILAYRHTRTPAYRDGPRRYRVSPLNHDLPLYNRPQAETDITHLAEPDNVPWPLSRQRLARHLTRYYAGANNSAPSLALWLDGDLIAAGQILVCDLSDQAGGWAHTPPPNGQFAVDPVLGRIALPADAADPAELRVTWHEGFTADLGGGEYERGASLPMLPEPPMFVRVPDDQPTLGDALAKLKGSGVIEITDNGRYAEALNIEVKRGKRVEIRASNRRRPVLDVNSFNVTGAADSAFALNGLLVTGATLEVSSIPDNRLAELELSHCTLVPGLRLTPDGEPVAPASHSLVLGIPGLEVCLKRCILGGIRSHPDASVSATDCMLDATAMTGVAYAAPDGGSAGGRVSLESCTLIGKLHAREVGTVSNSILLARLTTGDTWPTPVWVSRRQQGCLRFSYVPVGAIAPRQYRCQPALAIRQAQLAAKERKPDLDDGEQAAIERSVRAWLVPGLRERRYGRPAYGQLTTSTPPEIRQGAEDEAEMGVARHLYGQQRVTNLRIRLREYLRVGLEAGIFHES